MDQVQAPRTADHLWVREGGLLRDIIDGVPMSIAELARRSDVLRPQIQRYVSGEIQPSRQTLVRLAKPLGRPARDLIAIYEPVGNPMDEDLAKAVRELSETVKELTDALRPEKPPAGMTEEARRLRLQAASGEGTQRLDERAKLSQSQTPKRRATDT